MSVRPPDPDATRHLPSWERPVPLEIPIGLLERFQRLDHERCRHVRSSDAMQWWELRVFGSRHRLSLPDPMGWMLLAECVKEMLRASGVYYSTQYADGGGHRAILRLTREPGEDPAMGLHSIEGVALLAALLDLAEDPAGRKALMSVAP